MLQMLCYIWCVVSTKGFVIGGDICMMNTDRLRGIIAEKGYSQRKIAAMLGMSEKTFYDKMKKGVFDSDEISEIIAILDIKKTLDIFFTELGA